MTDWEIWKKKAEVSLSADLVAFSQGQGHWKWHTVVEVNGAYKHIMNKRILLKRFWVMSNIFFPLKIGSWINTTDNIDLHAKHIDKNIKRKWSDPQTYGSTQLSSIRTIN